MMMGEGERSNIQKDDDAIVAMIHELRERLDELERNKPAHGLNPDHIMAIEETENRIEELEERLARLNRV